MSDYDDERRRENARRRRALDGTWMPDLEEHLRATLHVTRVNNLGRLSLAVALAKSVCDQVGPALYWSAPQFEAGDEAFEDLIAEMMFWQLAQRQGAYVYGLRESAYLVEWSADAGRPRVVIVTPDDLLIETHPDNPDNLQVVRRCRWRIDPTTGKESQFWDVYDLKGGELRVEDLGGKRRDDLLPPEYQPGTWPWVDAAGPFMPWVVYHAAPTGKLWDPWTLCELFDASFDVAVLWNGYHHVMRDASWAQKYAINLELASTTRVSEGTAEVVTAPTSLLRFRTIDGTPGEIGVLEPAVDVVQYGEAVLTYQRTAIATLGLHPADLEKTGGAESGYAIQLRRSAQRRMAEAMEPQFRVGDEATLSLIARVSNTFGGTSYPTEGYRIVYAPPADAVTERVEQFDYNAKLYEAGLLSKSAWLRATFPGMTEEEAFARVVDIEAERQMVARMVRNAVTGADDGRDDAPGDSPDPAGDARG